MKLDPKELRLYAVTDRAWSGGAGALLRQVEAALEGGATLVQVREKHLPDVEFLEEARQITALCHHRGVRCILNDRAALVSACDADGVHVGQDDLAAGSARALLGPDRILGVSAHSVEEALRAQAAGADYLGVGAAFATPTKSDATPIARESIRAITAAVQIPAVAIGGITRENLPRLSGCGLSGVAVVSALFSKRDIRAAAQELRRLTEEIAAPAR